MGAYNVVLLSNYPNNFGTNQRYLHVVMFM